MQRTELNEEMNLEMTVSSLEESPVNRLCPQGTSPISPLKMFKSFPSQIIATTNDYAAKVPFCGL